MIRGVLLPISLVCASSHRRLVMHGETVSPEEFPFVVSLHKCKEACELACSGSLIAPDIVITAGHCFYDVRTTTKSGTKLKRPFEEWQIETANKEQRRKVLRASINGYGVNVADPKFNDMALIFLDSPFIIEEGRVETIPVDTEREVVASDIVSGLGYGWFTPAPWWLSFRDGKLRVLKDAVVHTSEECDEYYFTELHSFGFRPETLCFGKDNYSRVCAGDSGGPVVRDGKLVGVMVSSGSETCFKGPSVATRVLPNKEWILSELAGREPTPVSIKRLGSHCKNDGEWQCKSKHCIPAGKVCDGIADCYDGSDEDFSFCEIDSMSWSALMCSRTRQLPQILRWFAEKKLKERETRRRCSAALESVQKGLDDCGSVFNQFLVEKDKLKNKVYRLIDNYDPLIQICKEFTSCVGDGAKELSNRLLEVCEADLGDENQWFIKAHVTCSRDINTFLTDQMEENTGKRGLLFGDLNPQIAEERLEGSQDSGNPLSLALEVKLSDQSSDVEFPDNTGSDLESRSSGEI
jgi:hypothetical protein